MMRLLIAAACALALPLTAAQAAPPAAPAKKTVKTLILRAEGLSIVGGSPTPVRASFDSPRAQAIATIASIRGPALKTGTIEDCGSGTPMGYAKFKGGLELSFVDGKFVGWTLDEKGDKTLKTVKGIGLGSSRAAFVAAYPKATIEESSLGIEYASDDAGSGIFTDNSPTATIDTMWAGQTCIAR
jgi:hypothetical protein